jgi:hypothetical protein
LGGGVLEHRTELKSSGGKHRCLLKGTLAKDFLALSGFSKGTHLGS